MLNRLRPRLALVLAGENTDRYVSALKRLKSAAHSSFRFQDCAARPCLNGGTCVDLIDKFACFCKDGYTGKACQDDIDVCSAAASNVSLCFNGATCVDGEGSNFTCR